MDEKNIEIMGKFFSIRELENYKRYFLLCLCGLCEHRFFNDYDEALEVFEFCEMDDHGCIFLDLQKRIFLEVAEKT